MKVKGQNLVEQKKRRTWSTDTGWATVRIWEGTQAGIDALAANLLNLGQAVSIDISGSGAKYILSATYPDSGDQQGTDNQAIQSATWELYSNDIQQPIRTHPYFDPDENGGGDALRALYSKIDADIADGVVEDTYGNAIADAYKNRAVKGVTHYLISQWVLRRTITAGRDTSIRASMSNVNKIEAPPAPSAMLDNLPSLVWIKKSPQVTQRNNRYDIVQEWWGLDNYDPIIYS